MASAPPGFVEAYNARRHGVSNSSAGPVPRVPLPPPTATRAERLFGNLGFGPAARTGRAGRAGPREEPSRWDDYGYSLVRSDVEEDQSRGNEALPDMPVHAFGVRQRSLQNLGDTCNGSADAQDRGRMAWVETSWFQGLSGFVICINAIVIGLETDIALPVWFYVDQALLSFFCFELAVRLMRHGCRFFSSVDCIWNCFDFGIVVGGVCDEWMVPLLEAHGLLDKDLQNSGGGRMPVICMLLRLLRLLRIVRLIRLVRSVRPLYELAQGVMEALQGMFWVLVFMVMTLYSVSILCNRLIGHGDVLPEDTVGEDKLHGIQVMFGSVQDGMFTLFGTMSSWSLLKFVPLFQEEPYLKPLFVLFYIFAAWALLAVMTGVVSENMIAIREQLVKEDEQREEIRKSMITKTLIELFREADSDHSGTVSREEFDAMLKEPELTRKISRNTRLKVHDLENLFERLDYDGGGTIRIDAFIAGFKWANEPLRAKSLVKLQERVQMNLKSLENNVTQVVEARVAEVQKLVAAPLRKVHAIAEQLQTLDVHFTGIRNALRDQALELPTPEEVRDVEARLNAKMAGLLKKLEEVERLASERPVGRLASVRRGSFQSACSVPR